MASLPCRRRSLLAALGWVGLGWVLAQKAADAWHVGVSCGAGSLAGQLTSRRNEKAVVTL